MPAPPPPLLTDRAALRRNRLRASRRGPALFLHELVADEMQDRLAAVNRAFTAPAVVTSWPQVWEGRLPGARIVPDDDRLDLSPGAHDCVIHALALHWANDPVGQLIQCARALRPDGLLLAALFGGQTLASLRSALAEAEAAETGGLSPRVLPMADIRDAGGLLARAGLALPVADSLAQTVLYGSAAALLADLRAMGEANAMAARLRHPTRRGVLTRALAALDATRGSDGRLAVPFEIVVLTGWAPDLSQPKPLRPGSARQGLAEALAALRNDSPQDG
jgi:SAM-dependent methyltransferase